jgi:hypothetical protein
VEDDDDSGLSNSELAAAIATPICVTAALLACIVGYLAYRKRGRSSSEAAAAAHAADPVEAKSVASTATGGATSATQTQSLTSSPPTSQPLSSNTSKVLSARTLLLQLVSSGAKGRQPVGTPIGDVVPIKVDDGTWINAESLQGAYRKLAADDAGGSPADPSSGTSQGAASASVRYDIDLEKDLLVYQDQVLGSGATGFVFKGLYLGQAVAIKVIVPPVSDNSAAVNEEEMRSMRHELEIMARLAHANVVRVLGGNIKPPTMLIVEELMGGGSLHARIHRTGSSSAAASGAGASPLPTGAPAAARVRNSWCMLD